MLYITRAHKQTTASETKPYLNIVDSIDTHDQSLHTVHCACLWVVINMWAIIRTFFRAASCLHNAPDHILSTQFHVWLLWGIPSYEQIYSHSPPMLIIVYYLKVLWYWQLNFVLNCVWDCRIEETKGVKLIIETRHCQLGGCILCLCSATATCTSTMCTCIGVDLGSVWILVELLLDSCWFWSTKEVG